MKELEIWKSCINDVEREKRINWKKVEKREKKIYSGKGKKRERG